ncbi:hypothetical protein D3C75_926170 [compost metagenome]
MLDIGTQCVAVQRRLYRIGTLTRHLDHQVPGGIDAEGIVADSADHCVITRTTREDVVTGSTHQCVVAAGAVEAVITHPTGHDVVRRVAIADEVAGSGEEQMLDISAQCVAGQRGLYGVLTVTRHLDHQVPG